MSLIVQVYALLLRVYPREFQAEFAEEMRAVFAEAVNAAARQGAWPLARLCLHEIADWPQSLLNQHRLARTQAKGMIVMRTADHGQNSPNPSELGTPSRGAWREALPAALPHVLTVTLAMLPLATFQVGSAVVPLLLMLCLAGVVVVALVVAWRQNWPNWSASWLAYALMLVLLVGVVVVQTLRTSAGQLAEATYLHLVVPLTIAAGLYAMTRWDRLKGLLAAVPLVIGLWMPVLEFVRMPLHNWLMIGMWILVAAVSALIVRLNNVRSGIWLILGASLAAGVVAAYARTYWHNIPLGHSELPTVSALVGRVAIQLLASSALVIGPLLLWTLAAVARRSGSAGTPGHRIALGGFCLILIGSLSYFWWYFAQRSLTTLRSEALYRYGDQWPPVVLIVGGVIYLGGALWLCAAAKRHDPTFNWVSAALLVAVPPLLPLVAALPDLFGYRLVLAGQSLELFNLSDRAQYLIYTTGLVWLLLGGWLVTRLGAPPRPGTTA